MSSRMRENRNNIVRRMVSLPKNILEGISRVTNQEIDLMGIEGQNNHPHPHHQNFHSQQPPLIQEEYLFPDNFEQQFGTMRPFFYLCRFMDALEISQTGHKLMFMYIHSPEHPFTPSFCRETLCSELVVQFIDTNFVCWGGFASSGDGLQMATALRVSTFPFCAVVALADGHKLAVLQQMEGPMSPAELVEILQRTLEEQGVAFGSGRYNQDEKRRADQRLREEQDAAYVAALQIDQEQIDNRVCLCCCRRKKDSKRSQVQKIRVPKPGKHKENSVSKQPNKVKPASISAQTSQTANVTQEKFGLGSQLTKSLIRLPDFDSFSKWGEERT
ncbi:hypothetical protein DH2020_019248 [Rehmannia glutinosa]|uniref:UAS domain-containing protein n=1 Tax=Rehmannia glutinosa TaxID=99300 RepID=A0ABR0WNX7_REHGL